MELERAVARFEVEYGIPLGATALLPNIKFARALVATGTIAQASSRVTACLMASEDMAADLGWSERAAEQIALLSAAFSRRMRCDRSRRGGLPLHVQ